MIATLEQYAKAFELSSITAKSRKAAYLIVAHACRNSQSVEQFSKRIADILRDNKSVSAKHIQEESRLVVGGLCVKNLAQAMGLTQNQLVQLATAEDIKNTRSVSGIGWDGKWTTIIGSNVTEADLLKPRQVVIGVGVEIKLPEDK